MKQQEKYTICRRKKHKQVPAIRYDKNIIEAQMKLMNYDKSAQQLYQLMAENIHKRNKK